MDNLNYRKLFQEPRATQLTLLRIQARRKRRLTYDCMNTRVQGEWVYCRKGYKLPSPGRQNSNGLGLLSVLKGRSSQICQKCKDYDGEVTE